MANPTTNYGFVLPMSSDLVTDLPADFDVALQGVDTRLKALQPGTTLGDLAYSSATANTNTRLAVGTTGQVLTVAGGVPTWATPAGGGGKVLQVITATTSTEKSIASTSFTDTNLTVTITPSSSSSRIMILASQTLYLSGSGVEFVNVGMRLRRASTTVLDYSGTYNQAVGIYTETVSGSTDPTLIGISPFTYVDSPATTSATTYTIQVAMSSTASRNAICQQGGSTSSIIALEIGA